MKYLLMVDDIIQLLKEEQLRIRGIEPRSVPWEGTMIPLH